jgi:LmbE family N-acetylglucosaminyl deacetylase
MGRTVTPKIYLVVAHPDDESFWFGGALLMFRDAGIDVAIVCLTNGANEVRNREFEGACAALRCKGIMLTYPDGGLQDVSYFGNDLTAILQSNGVAPTDLTCVITHAPHGNERSHWQHVQCSRHVRKWCASKRIPFGFFSERDLREVTVTGKPSSVNARVSSSALKLNLAAVLGGGGTLRQRAVLVRDFRKVRSLMTFHVDIESKHALLSHYPSQLGGLREYETYRREYEYLYLDSQRAAESLARSLACLSS